MTEEEYRKYEAERQSLLEELTPIMNDYDPAVFWATMMDLSVQHMADHKECSRQEAALVLIETMAGAENFERPDDAEKT